MSGWQDWPAFGGREIRSGSLVVSRAAYGKAHRGTKDYRWLAASEGFETSSELRRLLNMGSEELENVECPQVRIARDTVLCVAIKPSRTVDKGGRRTPLEKHMLQCRLMPDMVPIVAVFALLEEISALADREWFDSYTAEPNSTEPSPQWEDPNYYHRLPGAVPAADGTLVEQLELNPVLWLGTLDRRLSAGIDELREATSVDALGALYAGLERGLRPSILKLKSERPLTPQGLGALLLPLAPREIAISGGVPTAILPEAEAANWDGVAVQRQSGVRVPKSSPLDETALARGRQVAEALLGKRPERLSALPRIDAAPVRGAEDAPRPIATQASRDAAEPAAASVPMFPSGVQPSVAAPTTPSAPPTLPAAPARVRANEPSTDWKERAESPGYPIKKFALSLRSWSYTPTEARQHNELAPIGDALLVQKVVVDAHFVRDHLQRAIAAVVEDPGNGTTARHVVLRRQGLAMKLDICRAWFMAIAPHQEVYAALHPFQTEVTTIEPLFMAAYVDAADWAAHCTLGEDTVSLFIRTSIAQAKRVRNETNEKRFIEWGSDVLQLLPLRSDRADSTTERR